MTGARVVDTTLLRASVHGYRQEPLGVNPARHSVRGVQARPRRGSMVYRWSTSTGTDRVVLPLLAKADVVDVVHGETELVSGVQLVPAPGHSSTSWTRSVWTSRSPGTPTTGSVCRSNVCVP
jgi:hypothetical protein